MAETDFDPSLADVRRQLISVEERMNDSVADEVFSGTEDDSGSLEGQLTCLSEYTKQELKLLSRSLGKYSYLEIDGVKELDWADILNHKYCKLDELRVTIKSPRALADLVEALCNNTSLSVLELDYYHIEDYSQDEESDERNYESNTLSTNELRQKSVDSSLPLNDIFFKSLMPLQQVVLRGITPLRPSCSVLFDSLDHATTCSWQYLTIEDCNLIKENFNWMSSCITNLEEIAIRNCELSEATIQFLSEAYLTSSTSRKRHFLRKSSAERCKKNPLRVLDLSNNDWAFSSNNGIREVEIKHHGIFHADAVDSSSNSYRCEERNILSLRSSAGVLASWLDSLSNLVELNLSNNPLLFNLELGNRGMDELCGTVNQSLKRLSLRNCQLVPYDLHQIVNTFCWLEAIDLSENPALISSISQLSQLEYLGELVLENMIEYNTNDTFEFERRMCDEDLDWETEGHGLTCLLLELLSDEENASFPDDCPSMREIRRHRQKPVKRLNLSGNIIDKEILRILSVFNSLEVLILMGCQINGDGITELFSGNHNWASGHSSLRELYLASNIIGDIGILTLTQNIQDQRLPLLEVLNIDSNVISVEAFRIFVEDGLLYSNRLKYVQVSDDGVITHNQQHVWNEISKMMEHNLLLNQAGRFTLFLDGDYNLGDEETVEAHEGDNHVKTESKMFSKNQIPTSLWPLILENADSIYGKDALFHFLHKRPDLFLSSSMPQTQRLYQTPVKSIPKASSPNGVEDFKIFI